jgi:hypothetical protein
MGGLFLFLHDLFASWMAWIGGILRMIPIIEATIEPKLQKFPRVNRFLETRWPEWKKNLKTLALLCLFVGCYRAWSFEHKNAETAMYGPEGKAEAWSKYNACNQNLAVKSALADAYSVQIGQQRGSLDKQQDTFNGCILAMGLKNSPEPLKIDVMLWKIPAVYTFPNIGQAQFWTLVLITNKVQNTTRGTLHCDVPFTALRSTILTHGNAMRSDYEQTKPDAVHVEFLYPPWSAQNPLVFSVVTKPDKEISSCAFKLD